MPEARLSRHVNLTQAVQSKTALYSTSSYLWERRGRCAHAWHRVNIRVSSSSEGGTELSERERERERKRGVRDEREMMR